MPSEQWTTGLVTVSTASQTVIGTASCDWLNQLAAAHVFKIGEDGQPTYTIATILAVTRLQLSANYAGTGGSGKSYIAHRSFTLNRGYWRPINGDDDWADRMSHEIVDKIDTDIQNLNASMNDNLNNIRGVSIFYPIVSGDDGYIFTGGFASGVPAIFFGHDGVSVSSLFIRFPFITIPNGTIIRSAFIRLTSNYTISNVDCNVNIYFNDEDDAVAPTSFGTYNSKSLTAAIAWNNVPTQTLGQITDTPELKTILQPIINKNGFVSNNAVMVMIKNNGSDNGAFRGFSSIEYLAGIEKAELHVVFDNLHTDIANTNNRIVNLSASVNINASEIIELQNGITNLNASLTDLAPSGSMYLYEASPLVNVDISASGQGVYKKIAGLTTGLLHDVTVSDNAFNVDKVGRYKVDWQISGDSQGVGKDYVVGIFMNGAEQNEGAGRKTFGAAGVVDTMSGVGLINVASTGYDIDLRMKEMGTGAGTDFDIFNLNFCILRAGGV